MALLHLLGDGLVAFEPIGGTNSTLVPDLATSIPTPTDGGRTYTFELRSGIRYSNGEVVAPGDFRRAIERGSPSTGALITDLYGGLVGGEACENEPRTCDLSEGIVTDDATGTITFHLVAPDPEFLYKLTLPFAYPVPPSTPDEDQATEGVPGTGPYMLEAPMTAEGLALVRNPHFRRLVAGGTARRVRGPDRVDVRGRAAGAGRGRGRWRRRPRVRRTAASDSLEELFVRFAAQVHTSPVPGRYFAVLDTESPPFDDVHVRRAMNLAVDRERVVQILGGEAARDPRASSSRRISRGTSPTARTR